jgi:hypothetical protein
MLEVDTRRRDDGGVGRSDLEGAQARGHRDLTVQPHHLGPVDERDEPFRTREIAADAQPDERCCDLIARLRGDQDRAAGRDAMATIAAQLINMRDGGFISAHDFHISTLIAEVVCGGDVDAGSLVTEEYLMAMERQRFCALLEHPKTQERVMGMLSTGKPVRN